MPDFELQSDKIRLPDSLEAVERLFYGRGWSDGLPIVPPTEERILKMLAGTRRRPDVVVGAVAPRWGAATAEKIAINAVMAGCLPEYMPVLIAAVQAVTDNAFNLYGLQATTHPAAPLIVVNGPVARKLDMNSGYGLFGPGTKSNAAIGRALRFILMNVGGALPGRLDLSTQGQPGKYTYCIAENEAENPWGPLHVERGFARDQSAVTVCPSESPHNINDRYSRSGAGILTSVAGTMASTGSNNATTMDGEPMVALSPEHAFTIAKDGFSKADVKRFLFEKGRIRCDRLAPDVIAYRMSDPQRWGVFDETASFPICRKAEDIMVIVAGGAGKHSSFIPTNASALSVTKAVEG